MAKKKKVTKKVTKKKHDPRAKPKRTRYKATFKLEDVPSFDKVVIDEAAYLREHLQEYRRRMKVALGLDPAQEYGLEGLVRAIERLRERCDEAGRVIKEGNEAAVIALQHEKGQARMDAEETYGEKVRSLAIAVESLSEKLRELAGY